MKRLPLGLVALVLVAHVLPAQGGQYLGPGFHPAPVPPPGGRGRPNRPAGQNVLTAAKVDPIRWESWWGYNREDLLPARGLPEDALLGTADSGLGRAQTPAETRARVMPVFRAALEDRSSDVRGAACIAIGRNGDAKDVPLLVAHLTDRDRRVVECAILGLGLLRQADADAALLKALGQEGRTSKERSLALLALGLSGGETVRPLMTDGLAAGLAEDRRMATRATHTDACRAIAAGLWSGGDLGVTDRAPAVADALRAAHAAIPASDEVLRAHILLGMAKLRDGSTRGFLAALLKDPIAGVRRSAAVALGRAAPGDDVVTADLLVTAAAREPDAEARHAMTIALGRLASREGNGADKSFAALLKEAQEQDRQHRAFALIGLGLSRRKEASAPLKAAFEEAKDEVVRGAAATALGIANDTSAWPLIKERLAKRGNPTLTCHLLNYIVLTRHPEGLGIAATLLKESKDPDVVSAAALTLGIGGYSEAGGSLVGLISKTSVPEIRGACAAAAGRLGDRRMVEPLITALDEVKGREETKASLVAALGLLVGRQPILGMTRAIIDADPGTRIEALDLILDLL